MAGLVGYDSSDEDEDVQELAQAKATSSTVKQPQNGPSKPSQDPSPAPAQPLPSSALPSQPPLRPVQGPALGPTQGPALGPAPGPSLPEPTSTSPSSPSALPNSQPDTTDPPRSPYSSTRTLIQDLTLPSVPNTSIPPSPPGSPPLALTSKFDTFLDLKRAKGIHFNARLSSSAAARNPALMDKLLAFVGVETTDFESPGVAAAAGQQYETTLPKEVWDPTALPGWAYKTPLRRAQERAAKERERRAGERVEFVSAGAVAAVGEVVVGDRTGTPGTGMGTVPAVTGKRKTRFDER